MHERQCCSLTTSYKWSSTFLSPLVHVPKKWNKNFTQMLAINGNFRCKTLNTWRGSHQLCSIAKQTFLFRFIFSVIYFMLSNVWNSCWWQWFSNCVLHILFSCFSTIFDLNSFISIEIVQHIINSEIVKLCDVFVLFYVKFFSCMPE